MPPAGVTVAEPVVPPLHKAAVGVAEDVKDIGSAMVTFPTEEHPLASVTVTE